MLLFSMGRRIDDGNGEQDKSRLYVGCKRGMKLGRWEVTHLWGAFLRGVQWRAPFLAASRRKFSPQLPDVFVLRYP
jgi:hypothetical protein